jgi:nuclear transport factor 2 (NTF2) superfamily protein
MSKNLIVRCFLENAREEGKEVVLKDGNTYNQEVKSYDVVKNTLVINGNKIAIKNVYESRDGYLLRIGEYVLEAA